MMLVLENGDYHMTYLKCYVLLISDVYENFRKTCIQLYNLDPTYNLTAPYLAWDAMLIMTDINMKLLYDIDMLNMIEKMKRGGLCFVGSKRYVKANNQHLPDYDPKQPSNYIWYGDVNNLFGCSMFEYLPYKDLT